MKFKDYFKIAVVAFVFYLCINYWKNVANAVGLIISATMPIAVGGVIAYFVNILMSFYERHYFSKSNKKIVKKTRRTVCMTGAFLTIIAIVSLIVRIVIPQFVSCLQLLFKSLPSALSFLINKLNEFNLVTDNIGEVLAGIDWSSKIDQMAKILTSGVGDVMSIALKTLTGVFSGIISGFLSIVFAIYILAAKDRLKTQFVRLFDHYLSEKWQTRIFYVLKVLDDCFHRYITGQCTEAVVLGVLCTLGMWIIGIPYAPMIGALVGFTALIPVAGAYIGAFVGAIMLLTVAPIKSLVFLIFILILQQLEGNLIYPRVVGNSIGLPAIWVLAAVTIGGGVLGILGMLLSVPIAAAVYRILRDDINGKNPFGVKQ
ncbi:MAG: AI-2E family transporter [Clostridia bacterium]|nr:AI-2E family transporter [Clostridia bacterium]